MPSSLAVAALVGPFPGGAGEQRPSIVAILLLGCLVAMRAANRIPDPPGLLAAHPWLGLGHIPAGLYDLLRPTPSLDKPVARIDTLIVANSCARRAERVAFLMLLSAELPGFVQANPPKYIYSTELPLAREARQYFIKGEPELADLYFPWLVDLMSPAYWVYFDGLVLLRRPLRLGNGPRPQLPENGRSAS
jgi:hypothetical protein